MSDLTELLTKCQEAKEGSRELDYLIHIRVANGGRTGQYKSEENWIATARSLGWGTPVYTYSVDAILSLIATRLPGSRWGVGVSYGRTGCRK